MDKAVNFVAVLGVIIVIVLGYVVFKKMEIYGKGHEKYVFSSAPQEKYFVSRPEWWLRWLNNTYKEEECASFEKEKP